ncbi:MAG: hypothetical protein JWO40_610 [Candidatus Doudnabacteria bacterium]|nr:hypothetical protein [Candidatus Doudnabacteria bacterium]
MIVIGIIGAKASGKDTIAKYIAEKHSGKHHSHSEILEDLLKILVLPNSRENAIKLVSLRDVFGENVLINALNKKIKADDSNLEIITGIRFENELENIRKYPNNKIIFISSEIRTRFERQHKRNEKSDDQSTSFERFIELEQAITERNISSFADRADIVIENNGDQAELFVKVDQALQGLI